MQSACELTLLLGDQEPVVNLLHLCLEKQSFPQYTSLLKRKSEERQTMTTDRNTEPSLCSGSPGVYRNNPNRGVAAEGVISSGD